MTAQVRVLVVDDDTPTRVGVRTILSSEPDLEVVGEASSGMQAIELARALNPDIVLMDVRLPDQDGISVTRAMLEGLDPDATAPRVIMLTTFDYDEYVFQSLQAGASGFLLKRMPAEELVEAVRTVAEGNALPAPARTRELISAFASVPDEPRHSQFAEALTTREAEVLAHIAHGLSNAEIADTLGLSIETIRTHVKHVYMKTGARDRAHAVIIAYETGLVRQSR